MSIINSGSYAREFEPVGHHWFMLSEKRLDPIYPKLFEVVSSSQRFEVDAVFGGFRGVGVVSEGGSVPMDSAVQGPQITYAPVRYGTGFIITRDMIDDGQDQVIMKKKSEELSACLSEAKEDLLASVLDNAFSSTYAGVDGKELCATDHPIQDGLTIANELAAAADLSEAALEQALIDLVANMRNYRGRRVVVEAEKLVVHQNDAMEAHRILKSALRYGTADNDANALKDSGSIAEIMVHKRLTDTDAWFLKTNIKDGLKVFQRLAPYFASDNDFATENMAFAARERYSYGFSDYRCLFGSPGA